MSNFKVFMQRSTASVTAAKVVTLPAADENNQNKEVPELLFHDGTLGVEEGYEEKARFILATSDNSQAAIGYMVV